MTFEQIENSGRTYVNKNGIVFTPMGMSGILSVRYDVDNATNIELIKHVKELNVLLKGPGRVDYPVLSKFTHSG